MSGTKEGFWLSGFRQNEALIENRPHTRIFLMSGYTSLMDQMNLFELGVEKILSKPIDTNQLINLIENPEIQTGISHKDMIAVRISEIQKRTHNPCDLYLLMGKQKIIKVFSAGLPIEAKRLDRLLKNDVRHLYAKKKEILTIPSQFYVPVRISTLIKDQAIPCEFYYKSGEEYKLLLKTGTIVAQAHFDILKKHKTKKLFINDRDEALYQRYLENQIDAILQNPQVSSEQKSEVMFDLMQNCLQNVFTQPNNENIDSMKKAQQTLQGYLAEDKTALQEIIRLSKEEQGIYAHSIGVATLAYAIVLEMGLLKKTSKEGDHQKSLSAFSFESKEVRDIVFLGGLLHDVGKTILNMSHLALSPNFEQNAPSSIELYKTHPKVGYERLKNAKGIPPKALEVILQHEELCDGSGFPNGLTKANISIYTQLITLANHFDHLHRQQKKKGPECVLALKLESAKYNKHLLFVLEKMFNVPKKS